MSKYKTRWKNKNGFWKDFRDDLETLEQARQNMFDLWDLFAGKHDCQILEIETSNLEGYLPKKEE